MAKKEVRKSAGNSKNVKQAPASKGVSKSVLLIAFAVIVAAVIIAVALVIVNDNKTRSREQGFIDSQKDSVEAVTASVQTLLDNDGKGLAKVFDIEGNQLFLLRDTQGIAPVGEIPSTLKDKLWTALGGGTAGSQPRLINLEAWCNSKTIVGGLNYSEDLESYVAGSFGWAAVNCYADYADVALTDEVKLVIGAGLEVNFTAEELFNYIVSASRFGNTRGLLTASENWFNKTLDQLNQYQQEYLVYAFRNVSAGWDDFVTNHSDKTGGATTAADFGFVDGGDPYWLLRREVQRELAQVLGTAQLTEEYQVRLKINPRIQRDIQNTLDNGMAASITLSSTGQTVLDGTIMVVDTHTGYVVALIGGRSRNTIANQLSFNATSNVGVYKAARDILASDSSLTFASLLSYDTLSGQQEWGTLGGLTASGQLSLLGATPVVESTVTLNEIADFMSGLYINQTPRFIEQVQTSYGKNVYTADVVLDTSAMNTNPDMRCMLTGSTESQYVDYQQNTASGVATATASSELIVVGLYGTSAQGYSLSDSDYNMCVNTAIDVFNTALKHFPVEPKIVDVEGKVATKLKASQEKNSEFITQLIESWEKDLREMPINSVQTREEFEYAYSYYTSMVATYEGVVNNERLTELLAKLETVRTDRADELLKYAA